MEKSKLENYRMNKNKLEDVQLKIAECETFVCVQASEKEYPYCEHTAKVYGVARADSLEYSENCKEAKKLKSECLEVKEYISNINDPLTREIFNLLYLDGDKSPTWDYISAKLHGIKSGEAIRKKCERFWKKK